MWKYLSIAGITATVAAALIFWLLLTTLSMFFPFRSRLAPKLPPSLPKPNPPEKKRLPLKEYGPGLWATGGTAEDKHKMENGVEHTKKPEIDKE